MPIHHRFVLQWQDRKRFDCRLAFAEIVPIHSFTVLVNIFHFTLDIVMSQE